MRKPLPHKSAQEQLDMMTKTPIPRLVLTLGLPTTMSMLITNLYSIADTYFVSQLGTSASGATGIVFGLMAIIQAFGFMFGHGAGSNISRQLGAGGRENAKTFASTSFFLSLLSGALIALIGLLNLDALVTLLGSTNTILPFARRYGACILISAPAMAASCVLNNILRYEGKAFFAAIGLCAGGIINIALDALLIFVFDQGILGAGIATAISQYLSLLILITPFLRGQTQSTLSLRHLSLDKSIIGNIVAVGFPSLIRQGLNSLSVMILNFLASSYGDAAIAAMSITSRTTMFIFCVGLGIGQGFQPVSAFNYGAGNLKRVREAHDFALRFGIISLLSFAIPAFIFAPAIITRFRNDPAVIKIGTFALRAALITLPLMPVSVMANMLFQSIGKSGRATFLAALRSGLALIPTLLITTSLFGLIGIQTSQSISEIISAAISIPLVHQLFCTFERGEAEKDYEKRKE